MFLPKITIITPTFNIGDSIETTLLSVANQTYTNIEHIIVDGASTDKTLPTIRKYQKQHKNIRLLTEKDEGIYHAMNKGMDLCTGDWIYFMGADDTFYNENVLTDLFEQGLFSEEHVIYGNVMIKGDAPWAKDNSIYDGPFTLEKLFKWNICHQSILYPKSVKSLVGYYYTKYKVTSDWDYNFRCWAKYKFTYTEKIIAFFATGGKSSQGGDYSLYLDFPDNVVKYFDLDIHNGDLYQGTSPFFYPLAKLRENEYLSSIRELEEQTVRLNQHVADQQSEFNESFSVMQMQHEESKAALKSEFDAKITNLNSAQENILRTIKAEHYAILKNMEKMHERTVNGFKVEYGQIISNLKTEYDQYINYLKTEHAQFVTGLRTAHNQEVASLNLKHDQRAADLKTNHDQDVARVKTEYEVLIANIKAVHSESVETIKGGYEGIIKSLHAEQKSFWDMYQQKEYEFMKINESNLQHIDHLARTIAEKDLNYAEAIDKTKLDIEKLRSEVAAHKEVINSMVNSRTWKTGRILLAPLRLFRRK